jgi:hypothetical protein
MTTNSLLKSKSYNYVASVVAAYWVVSISMVYLNKVRAAIGVDWVSRMNQKE